MYVASYLVSSLVKEGVMTSQLTQQILKETKANPEKASEMQGFSIKFEKSIEKY